MKKLFSFMVGASVLVGLLAFSAAVQAADKSALMLLLGEEWVDFQSLVDSEEASMLIDRDSRFCFVGKVDVVAKKIEKWNKDQHFYSGGGGGHVLEKLVVTKKGIAGPKINLTIRSEVTGDLEPTLYVFKCR